MPKAFRYIGKSLERLDATDKICGRARYVEDMQRAGLLVGKLYTSEKAHARVRIDKEKALAIPGVVAVFTHADVPQNPYNSNQWFPGAKTDEDEYLLHETARHVGDRIALVVATTGEAAERGCHALKVTYEEQPAVIGLDQAMESSGQAKPATQLAFEKTLACGDIEKGFHQARHLIETRVTSPKIHHAAIENHSCLAEIDPFGTLVVWSPCQVVFQVQHIVAKAIGWPYHQVRVVKTIIGGSFGGKGIPILEPLCAFAAATLKQPVRIVMDRKDSIAATRVRNATRQQIRTGVDDTGKIVARELSVAFDGGAYLTNAAAIAMAFGKKAFRLYQIENQHYTGSTYYTHTTPGGACRGYGSPQLHAVSEINIDQAAKQWEWTR